MTTVLVTGVGAIIGYGILRSLRKYNQNILLIGSDIYPDAVGQAWADHFVLAPLTASEHYLDWLEKTIIEHKVNLVIPGIEQDLHFFSDNRVFFSNQSVAVVLNDARLINLTRDKWLMDQELMAMNSPVRIPSLQEGDFGSISSALGLPFIVKPRRSYASKGLLRIGNASEFSLIAQNLGNTLIAQPIVGSDDDEFTLAVFSDGTGKVCASIMLQRRLAPDGSTVKARVCDHPELNALVADLCAHFKPIGPTNLQFRKDGQGWKLLEINPRISSSTSLRTAFGYNECGMCLDYYLDAKQIIQPEILPGYAVRYIEDRIVYDRNNL